MLGRVQAREPAMEVQEPPAVWQRAAPVETRVLGAALVAVGRTRGARIPTVAQAQVVAPGWLGRDRVVKRAKEVERAKEAKRAAVAKRVPAV